MQSNKGFIWLGALIATVLAVIVVVGGAYYVGHQNASPAQPNYPDLSTTEQRQQESSATTQTQIQTSATAHNPTPAATINKSALTTNSSTPTITGTYANAGIVVVIAKGSIKMPTTRNDNAISVVWADESDHGGGVDTKTNGTYSDTVGTPLAVGTYTVGIYNLNSMYTNEGFQGYGAETLLASGTLTINSQSSGTSASWKTYTNATYGYHIQYPSDWNASAASVVSNGKDKEIWITHQNAAGSVDRKIVLLADVDKDGNMPYLRTAPKTSTATIAGTAQIAYFFSQEAGCSNSPTSDKRCYTWFSIPIYHNGVWYELQANYSADTYSGTYKDIFSTFGFSAQSSGTPKISVSNVDVRTITVQYENLPLNSMIEVHDNNKSPNWLVRSNPLAQRAGSVSLVLSLGTSAGQYYLVAVDQNGNVVLAKDASQNTYPVSAWAEVPVIN